METRILVTTAVSGGSLRALLEDAAARYGAERLLLGVERVAMDFPLPCPSGEGVALTDAELRDLRRRCCAAVWFSDALCAKYFTYRRGGAPRLVLFDDDETVRHKLRLAERLGIKDAYLLYDFDAAAPK